MTWIKPQNQHLLLRLALPWVAVFDEHVCFCRDLEEDPLFGDDISPDSRLSGSDWPTSSPPPLSPDHSKCDGKTEVHKIVNRFAVCHKKWSRVLCVKNQKSNLNFAAVSCVWCPMRQSRRITSKAQATTPTSETHTDRLGSFYTTLV